MSLSEKNGDFPQNGECCSKNQWQLIVFHVPTLWTDDEAGLAAEE